MRACVYVCARAWIRVTSEEGDKEEERVAVVRQQGKGGKRGRGGGRGDGGFPRRICNLKHGLV